MRDEIAKLLLQFESDEPPIGEAASLLESFYFRGIPLAPTDIVPDREEAKELQLRLAKTALSPATASSLRPSAAWALGKCLNAESGRQLIDVILSAGSSLDEALGYQAAIALHNLAGFFPLHRYDGFVEALSALKGLESDRIQEVIQWIRRSLVNRRSRKASRRFR